MSNEDNLDWKTVGGYKKTTNKNKISYDEEFSSLANRKSKTKSCMEKKNLPILARDRKYNY